MWVISIVTLLITPVITTHEPPSRGLGFSSVLYRGNFESASSGSEDLTLTPQVPAIEGTRDPGALYSRYLGG